MIRALDSATVPATPRRLRMYYSLFAIVLTLTLVAHSAEAASTTSKCLVLKRHAWGNLRKCETTEQVKQLKGKPADLAKCQTKFQEKLAKIAAKSATAAIACRFKDNGDGSVTDYDTGLMWEKKTGGSNSLCLLDDVHCVDEKFTWLLAFAAVGAPSGAADLVSIPFLAGHSDWRLPTLAELRTILLAPHPCGTNPCIDPIFGATAEFLYWTSSKFTGGTGALAIRFTDGLVFAADFGSNVHLRAVRAGL